MIDTRPEKDSNFTYHWLRSERSMYRTIAQWVNGEWLCIGEVEPVSPEAMWRRGWEYFKPVPK